MRSTPPSGLPRTDDAAQALQALFRPVARLMIGHGVTLAAATELLKQALVEEAVDSFALDAAGSSDARVALLTGVHRKDVRRLRELGSSDQAAALRTPATALVVARWISDPRFLHANRQPLALARTPGKGAADEVSFPDLVQAVSRDHSPRAMLDELLRLGIASVDANDRVHLQQPGFVPQPGAAEGLAFLGQHVSDHLSAAVHNNAPGACAPPMLDQTVFSTGLTAEQVDALHALARQQWHDQLVVFLQAATQAEARSQASPAPKHRIRLGSYFWSEPEPSNTAPHASLDTDPAATVSPSVRAKRGKNT